jgi:hypothetical protein
MIPALIGVVGGGALTALGAIFAYGRFVGKISAELAALTVEVRAARETLGRFGERIGRLETRQEVEQEFSGRVRGA